MPGADLAPYDGTALYVGHTGSMEMTEEYEKIGYGFDRDFHNQTFVVYTIKLPFNGTNTRHHVNLDFLISNATTYKDEKFFMLSVWGHGPKVGKTMWHTSTICSSLATSPSQMFPDGADDEIYPNRGMTGLLPGDPGYFVQTPEPGTGSQTREQ